MMASTKSWTTQMTPQDTTFYTKLGKRIAEARKAQGLTQVQLAEILGISQQTMAHYEGGKLRIAVSMLPPLSKAINLPVEELVMGTQAEKAKSRRGPASKMQRQLEQLNQLPRTKQRFVTEMLETILQQASH